MTGTKLWSASIARAVRRMADYLRDFRLFSPQEEIYCIAYGSNLCEARMKARCPEAEVYGTSMIYGYRLLFKKSMTGFYATIEQDANSEVPVVIYRISPYDEARLDRFEGFPKYYYKREFFLPIWNLDGRKRKKRRSCIAYIMHEYRLLGEPGKDYYRLLDEGYERWGFDKESLEMGLISSIGYRQAETWLKKYEKERDRT